MSAEFEREWNGVQIASGALSGDVLEELVRLGARLVQDQADLNVDGLAGPDTISEVEALLGINTPEKTRPLSGRRRSIPDSLPIPSRKFLETIYGSPSYRSHPSKPGALILDKRWVKDNIVKCTMHNGLWTYCHKLVSDEWKRLFKRACELSGYTPTRVWSFVPRRKMWSESKGPSEHTYGIAFDLDPHLNKYGMTSGTPLHENPVFVEVFEQAGWDCGINWRTPDPMHFSRVR